jgi:hypothetical protein
MNLRCVSVKKTHLFINGKTQFQNTNIIEDTYVYCNIPSTNGGVKLFNQFYVRKGCALEPGECGKNGLVILTRQL